MAATLNRVLSRGTARALVLFALAGLYYAIPNARVDFTRFNCHDSESYLALSHSLAHGRGYTRSFDPEAYVAHKMWPPGMAVLLLPATVGSEGALDWARTKRTVATLGLLGLVPLWLWTRRMAGDRTADLVVLATGLNPFFWHFSHQAMAEVPLFVWLVAALWAVDQTWHGRPVSNGEAALVGLACGLGLLIKAHAAGLALAPLAYLRAAGSAQSVRSRLASWLVFCLALALPFGAWLLRNQAVDARGVDGFSQLQQVRMADPMDPRSAARGSDEALGSMLSNLRRYAIYHLPSQVIPGLWPPPVFDWRGSGWPALALTLLLITSAVGSRPGARAALCVAAFLGALNLIYGYGGSPRFWVPVSLLVLALSVIRISCVVGRLGPRARTLVGLATSIALVVNLGAYITANERTPFNPTGPWAELAALFDTAAESGLATSGVLTPNPHAFRLVTGLPAPMGFEDARFEHMVARLDGAGPQPPDGSRLVLEVAPWGLFELPAPARGAELGDSRPRYPIEW